VVATQDSVGEVKVTWGGGSTATVGVCGRLISWEAQGGRRLICGPLDVCLFRAPTDNDCGGSVLSYESRWMSSGMDCLQRAGVEVSIKETDGSKGVVVIVNGHLTPAKKVLFSYVLPFQVIYTFLNTGEVLVKVIHTSSQT
jgi:Beta galactosidase small chain